MSGEARRLRCSPSSPRRPWGARALTVAALATAACRGEAEQARRAEAGRVARAVQVLRDAPNPEKRSRLGALRNERSEASDVRQLRDSCASAYALEVEVLDSIAAVRRAASDPAAPIAPAAVALLARAEAELGRAAELTRSCADLEGALRRRYRL